MPTYLLINFKQALFFTFLHIIIMNKKHIFVAHKITL